MAGQKIRIATVTDETHPLFEQRFVVQQWRDRVHCWGQVTSFSRKSRRHEGSISFASEQVTVEEYPSNGVVLSRALFDQNLRDMERRGARILRGRSETYVIERGPLSEASLAVAAELEINPCNASDAEYAEIVALAEEL